MNAKNEITIEVKDPKRVVTIDLGEVGGCLGCIGDRCPYYFVGDIGESKGKEFCGIGKDGLLSYGEDARAIADMHWCPVHSSYEEYLLTH